MRKLNLTDVFRFSRLVKDSGLRDTVSDTLKAVAEVKAKPAVNDGDLYNIGIDAFMSVVDMAAKKGVESSVYEFLAPVWGVGTDEVANMDLDTVAANLREMIAMNDFSAFFRKSEALTR